MSNETMTDARSLEDFIDAMEAAHGYRPQAWHTGQLMNTRDQDRFDGWKLARLRGEAAPEGQAVRALPAFWRKSAEDIGEKDSYDEGMGIAHRSCADELDSALSVPVDYKGLIREDESGVMRALADRVLGNAHPEEDARVEVAYAIARYLGMDCPAALSSPAAPAPVAGDAVRLPATDESVRKIVAEWHRKHGCGQQVIDDCLSGEIQIPQLYAEMILAALAQDRASQAGAAVPEGWRLVPNEPTDEMLAAFWAADRTRRPASSGYAAMLAAAPTPAAEGEVGRG